ncbi:ybaR [Symbiodinium natans]|uniref:YbaR protein n=1 Tax=Symbiodinium natans TaxID=878477 RepID=A0A812HPA1_9DINO|nr:ybaR [Symbiodinium natans]
MTRDAHQWEQWCAKAGPRLNISACEVMQHTLAAVAYCHSKGGPPPGHEWPQLTSSCLSPMATKSTSHESFTTWPLWPVARPAMPSAGGAAQATNSGFLGLFGISRESCAFGDPPDVDLVILCHEARGLDMSPGEQVFVSLRDQKRSDPEKLTAPGTAWQLRSARADSVLQIRAWAAPDEEAARTDAARRRLLGELRLPLSALRALSLSMLYQTWLTLDTPGLEGAELGPHELELKMDEGSRQLYQPKLCLSLCQLESASGLGKLALGPDAPEDVRTAQWSAVLRSQMQHLTMSSVMHRQSLKAGRPLRAPLTSESNHQLTVTTASKVRLCDKGGLASDFRRLRLLQSPVVCAERLVWARRGRFVPPDLLTREGVTPSYITKEVLLGVTIGFAQVPESVAFAFLAHVRPHVALHAAWIMGLFCSLLGGRPGMINGATGAFAAIIATFLPAPNVPGGNGAHVELLFPSVMLAGLFMLVASASNLSRFILLLPTPVMVGFCNGLAIVIGMAQLHPFHDESSLSGWKEGYELLWMLVITATSMATMEFLPKVPLQLFKVIPSSLMAILVAILIEFAIVRPCGWRTDTIGDVSEFTSETAFPIPFFVQHPSTGYNLHGIIDSWSSIQSILVQGILLCVVGSIESLMTSEVVESFTKTPSEGDRTLFAMGLGNMVSGFLGGMGGNAMTLGLGTRR